MSDDPLAVIGSEVGGAIRTAGSATIHAAELRARHAERLARQEAAGGRQEAVEYRRRTKAVRSTRRAGNYAATAARRSAEQDAEAKHWLAIIASAGDDRLAERAWKADAWPALATALRQHSEAGRDVDAALKTVVPERSFGDGKDVAAIIHWRVERHFETPPAQEGATGGGVAHDEIGDNWRWDENDLLCSHDPHNGPRRRTSRPPRRRGQTGHTRPYRPDRGQGQEPQQPPGPDPDLGPEV